MNNIIIKKNSFIVKCKENKIIAKKIFTVIILKSFF